MPENNGEVDQSESKASLLKEADRARGFREWMTEHFGDRLKPEIIEEYAERESSLRRAAIGDVGAEAKLAAGEAHDRYQDLMDRTFGSVMNGGNIKKALGSLEKALGRPPTKEEVNEINNARLIQKRRRK